MLFLYFLYIYICTLMLSKFFSLVFYMVGPINFICLLAIFFLNMFDELKNMVAYISFCEYHFLQNVNTVIYTTPIYGAILTGSNLHLSFLAS